VEPVLTDEKNPSLPPAGWYPDPVEIGEQRYWNGSAWGARASAAPSATQGTANPWTARAVPAPAFRPMVTFGEAIREGFRQYAKSTGRATRAEFWWFVLFVFIVTVVLAILDSALGTDPLLVNLWSLATLLPRVGVACRRLRDAGSSPWNVLWIFLPIAGLIILIVKLCRPSVPVRPLRFAPTGTVGAGRLR